MCVTRLSPGLLWEVSASWDHFTSLHSPSSASRISEGASTVSSQAYMLFLKSFSFLLHLFKFSCEQIHKLFFYFFLTHLNAHVLLSWVSTVSSHWLSLLLSLKSNTKKAYYALCVQEWAGSFPGLTDKGTALQFAVNTPKATFQTCNLFLALCDSWVHLLLCWWKVLLESYFKGPNKNPQEAISWNNRNTQKQHLWAFNKCSENCQCFTSHCAFFLLLMWIF